MQLDRPSLYVVLDCVFSCRAVVRHLPTLRCVSNRASRMQRRRRGDSSRVFNDGSLAAIGLPHHRICGAAVLALHGIERCVRVHGPYRAVITLKLHAHFIR